MMLASILHCIIPQHCLITPNYPHVTDAQMVPLWRPHCTVIAQPYPTQKGETFRNLFETSFRRTAINVLIVKRNYARKFMEKFQG